MPPPPPPPPPGKPTPNAKAPNGVPPKPAGAPAGKPAAPKPATPAGAKPAAPGAKPAAASPAAKPAAKPATPAIPKVCPVCKTPTLPGRRVCVRCNRDLIESAAKAEKRAREAAEQEAIDRKMNRIWLGVKLGAVAVVLVIAGAIGMLVYGGLTAQGAYPTNRVELATNFFNNIAQGTPESYRKAYEMVSLRARNTQNRNEDAVYRVLFEEMNNYFTAQYGKDWITKTKIERREAFGGSAVVAIIGGDEYGVDDEPILSDAARIELMTSRGGKMPAEDGKTRWAMVEIEGFPKNGKRLHAEPGAKPVRQPRQRLGQGALEELSSAAKNATTKPAVHQKATGTMEEDEK